jgi:glycosyltransferase involved in cell wall biosynthesis
VRALAVLREHGLETPLVLCGTHDGSVRERTFRELNALVRELRLGGLVHMLGYVPDADMPALYGEAVALVMPTFFGPTNIPVLEAWARGCPVLTSDLRGIREQVGEAALLADPRSVEEIAAGIERLWLDDGLRRTLAERGRERLHAFTPEAYRGRLLEILQDARSRIR